MSGPFPEIRPVLDSHEASRLQATVSRVAQLRRRRRALAAISSAAVAAAIAVPFAATAGGPGRARSVEVVSPPPTASPTTTSPPTAVAAPSTTVKTVPTSKLPPINLATLPVPSHYTCSVGLYFLAPGNQAEGECLPYPYLVGGTASRPSSKTACPAGSFMSMGPVECDTATGVVTAVVPGPNTCSRPGGPCPSGRLPLSPQASVLPWAQIQLPTGICPAGYYFGEAGGSAICVPYGYLPGGTSTSPNANWVCPAGSSLTPTKLTGTLCAEIAHPSQIVAPVPTPESSPSTAAWTAATLTITPDSLGAVKTGMSLTQAEGAAGVVFDAFGDGFYYPNWTWPPHLHLYVGVIMPKLRCVGASGGLSPAYAQHVVTPEGFPLGGTVSDLLRIYGRRATYYPAPGGGMTDNAGYVVHERSGDLAFAVGQNNTIDEISGTPGPATPNSCTG